MATKPVPATSALKAADHRLINQALFIASDALADIERLERTGAKVDHLRATHAELVNMLTLMKQEYFPGQE